MEGTIIFFLWILRTVLHGRGVSTRKEGSDYYWLDWWRRDRFDPSNDGSGAGTDRNVINGRNDVGQLQH
jgi:hypothetical protein